MIKKALFVGAIGLVAVAAAFGLGSMNHSTTSALTNQPIQPFAPNFANSGISSVALGNTQTGGQKINNLTQTNIPLGQRIAIPWVFTSGYDTVLDMDGNPGPGPGGKVGDIIATLDVKCDSTTAEDFLAQADSKTHPFDWTKTTTAVQGTPDDFLYSLVPPVSWLFRDTATATNFWYGSLTIPASVTLNTVFTASPWSPNGSAGTATTKNGGDSRSWYGGGTGTDSICIDSPQDSTSHTQTNYSPPLLGNTGGACSGGGCADAALYGPAPAPKNVQTGPGTVAMSANYVNRGPDSGTFTSHWEIEATNSGVADAVWASGGLKSLDHTGLTLAAASTVASGAQNMTVSCPGGSGEGLIVVKNVLWPESGTKDYFPADNANVFVEKVICTADASTLVDLAELELQPAKSVAVTSTGSLSSTPEEINLNPGKTATVAIRDVVSNNATTTQTATEWLDAESAGLVTATWGTASPLHSGIQSGTATATTTVTGMLETPGQSDMVAPLTVGCPALAPEGRYSVVIKAMLAPTTNGESKPQDNAQRLVIMVNCWASAPTPTGGADAANRDDGMGLYPRWVISQSNPDSRLSFAQPPSFPQDDNLDSKLQEPVGGYVERTLQLACFWEAPGGCWKTSFGVGACDTTTDAAGSFLTATDSQEDYRLAALGGLLTIDPDSDCLVAPAYATAGRPSDLASTYGSTACAISPYAMQYDATHGGPANVSFQQNADQDCDGVPDGVEVAFGTNPIASDTDGDTATDYVEMFDFTNPINTDTDSDGFLDKPSNVFGNNTNVAQDNCPTVANPDQQNTFGRARNAAINFTAASPAAFSGTGVLTGNTTLTDGSQAWTTNQWVNQTVTCNGQTMVVTSNNGTTLTGTAWSGGGNPGNGHAYSITVITMGASTLNDARQTWAHTSGTSTAVAATSMTDSTAGWTTNQWANMVVTSGGKTMVILSNTGTKLTGKPWLGGAPATGAYSIDQWALQTVVDSGKKLVIAGNNATTLTGAGPWSNAQPADGTAYGISTIVRSDNTSKVGNPAKSKLGDACNPDIDGDGLPNSVELAESTPQNGGVTGSAATDPKNPDTNGNHCVDGAEVLLGVNAATTGHNCPGSLSLDASKFFRACRFNLPPLGAFGAHWDAENDGVVDRVELDPWSTGTNCLSGTSVLNTDNNNDAVPDIVSIEGFYANPVSLDTDGDGCADYVQMNDVNGDGSVSPGDLLLVAQRQGGALPPNTAADEILDTDKNNSYAPGDLLQVAKGQCAAHHNAGGCGQTVCRNAVY